MDKKTLALRLVERAEAYAGCHGLPCVRYPESDWASRLSQIVEHAIDHPSNKYASLVITADQRFANAD